MNEKTTALRLLEAKGGNEKRKLPRMPIVLFLTSLFILGTENEELIPFGMLFLGISIGAFAMEMRWRRSGKFFWAQMSRYIDWSRVEEDAKATTSNQ